MYARLLEDREKAKAQTYYFMVSCRDQVKGHYSLSDKSFPFEFWASEVAYSNFPEYIVFDGVCLSFPVAHTSKTIYRDYGARGARYIQPFKIPVADEKTAIAIEEEIEAVKRHRWDNFVLVFVFTIEKAEKRATDFLPTNFILGRTKEVFLQTKKQEKYIQDFELITTAFNQSQAVMDKQRKKTILATNKIHFTEKFIKT